MDSLRKSVLLKQKLRLKAKTLLLVEVIDKGENLGVLMYPHRTFK